MQPKDGANGIRLPGRLSLSISLFFLFLSFLKFKPAKSACHCAYPSALYLHLIPLHIRDLQKWLVLYHPNQLQPTVPQCLKKI